MTRSFRISIGGRLILDGNPKVYEVAGHTSKKGDINTRMNSTFEKRKTYMKHETKIKFQDINGLTSGNFICLGQEKNM